MTNAGPIAAAAATIAGISLDLNTVVALIAAASAATINNPTVAAMATAVTGGDGAGAGAQAAGAGAQAAGAGAAQATGASAQAAGAQAPASTSISRAVADGDERLVSHQLLLLVS